MRANLEYVVSDIRVRVPLETMELEDLDQFTYNSFNTESDIVESEKYKSKIGNLPKNGKVVVTYNAADIPVHELDRYAKLGGNPMAGEECVRVLVKSGGIAPTLRGVRNGMARLICSSEVAEEFYCVFGDEYSNKEKLYHLSGMMYENSDMVSSGIKRVMIDYTSGYEGYFIGRAFIERLSNFNSVKKVEKGKETSNKTIVLK